MRIALNKIQTFYFLLAVSFAALFLFLATQCYFSDSEIWLLAISKTVFSANPVSAVYHKWIFHAIIAATSFWSNDNLAIYTTSRLVFALISLASLLLIAATFSKVYQKRTLFLPVFLVCLTSTLFFNQGFRIRADVLALFFHALFLYFLFYKKTSKRIDLLLFMLFNLALLLCTAKAIIFIALHILLGIYFYGQQEQNKKNLGFNLLLSVLAPLTICLFAVSCLSIVAPAHKFLQIFQSAGDFYIKSFHPELGGARFFSEIDFMYVLRFLRQSYVHTFICLSWLILFFVNIFRKNKDTLVSLLNLYGALLLSFVLVYNQKLPFFLGPFLTPLWAVQYCYLEQFLSTKKFTQWISPLLIGLACWISWNQYKVNTLFNTNIYQKDFIGQLQSYQRSYPKIKIYDVIGTLPLDNIYYEFIGPGEVTRRQEILRSLKQNPPEMFLQTYKNIYFGEDLNLFLMANYVEFSPGVWLRAKHYLLNKEHSSKTKIYRKGNDYYWLISHESPHMIFDQVGKTNIMNECLFLDPELKVSQNNTTWVAVPLKYTQFSMVLAPQPLLTHNPFIIFRFDTSF